MANIPLCYLLQVIMLIIGQLGVRDYVIAVTAATHYETAKVTAAKQKKFCLTPTYRTGLPCFALPFYGKTSYNPEGLRHLKQVAHFVLPSIICVYTKTDVKLLLKISTPTFYNIICNSEKIEKP